MRQAGKGSLLDKKKQPCIVLERNGIYYQVASKHFGDITAAIIVIIAITMFIVFSCPCLDLYIPMMQPDGVR